MEKCIDCKKVKRCPYSGGHNQPACRDFVRKNRSVAEGKMVRYVAMFNGEKYELRIQKSCDGCCFDGKCTQAQQSVCMEYDGRIFKKMDTK